MDSCHCHPGPPCLPNGHSLLTIGFHGYGRRGQYFVTRLLGEWVLKVGLGLKVAFYLATNQSATYSSHHQLTPYYTLIALLHDYSLQRVTVAQHEHAAPGDFSALSRHHQSAHRGEAQSRQFAFDAREPSEHGGPDWQAKHPGHLRPRRNIQWPRSLEERPASELPM